mmetsp:Transcript_61667/g.122017  ORF Transcript_61667/g.122017 Transcript_61667/m.122017 type:complete len:281 (+) Transcript_61667:187-1029(+)
MTSCPTATCLSLHASSLGSRKSGGLMRAFLHFRDSVLDPLAGFLDAFGFCPPELPDAFALGLLMPAPPEGFDAVDGADESAELLLSCPMGFALVVADGRLLPTASVSLGVLVLEIRLLLPSSVLEGLFGGTEETATGETGEGGCKRVPDLAQGVVCRSGKGPLIGSHNLAAEGLETQCAHMPECLMQYGSELGHRAQEVPSRRLPIERRPFATQGLQCTATFTEHVHPAMLAQGLDYSVWNKGWGCIDFWCPSKGKAKVDAEKRAVGAQHQVVIMPIADA